MPLTRNTFLCDVPLGTQQPSLSVGDAPGNSVLSITALASKLGVKQRLVGAHPVSSRHTMSVVWDQSLSLSMAQHIVHASNAIFSIWRHNTRLITMNRSNSSSLM